MSILNKIINFIFTVFFILMILYGFYSTNGLFPFVFGIVGLVVLYLLNRKKVRV